MMVATEQETDSIVAALASMTSAEVWALMVRAAGNLQILFGPDSVYQFEGVPSSTLLREALRMRCPTCGPMDNHGEAPGGVCPACQGSGTQQVPGARLLPRGEHIEVR